MIKLLLVFTTLLLLAGCTETITQVDPCNEIESYWIITYDNTGHGFGTGLLTLNDVCSQMDSIVSRAEYGSIKDATVYFRNVCGYIGQRHIVYEIYENNTLTIHINFDEINRLGCK